MRCTASGLKPTLAFTRSRPSFGKCSSLALNRQKPAPTLIRKPFARKQRPSRRLLRQRLRHRHQKPAQNVLHRSAWTQPHGDPGYETTNRVMRMAVRANRGISGRRNGDRTSSDQPDRAICTRPATAKIGRGLRLYPERHRCAADGNTGAVQRTQRARSGLGERGHCSHSVPTDQRQKIVTFCTYKCHHHLLDHHAMSAASDLLTAYLAAELAILSRQSYTIGDRQLTLANLAEVRRERAILERRVAAESCAASSTGSRHRLADFTHG